MKIQKLVPWNWFKNEEQQPGNMPVRQAVPQNGYTTALQQIHRDFDNLVESFFREFRSPLFGNGQPGFSGAWLKPTLDISASDNEYTITIELPGVDQKDVAIDLSGDTLTIQGEKREDRSASDNDYYCVERSYGTFQRRLTLPEDANKEAIDAAFKDGIMTITIPRVESAVTEPKRIEVKTAA